MTTTTIDTLPAKADAFNNGLGALAARVLASPIRYSPAATLDLVKLIASFAYNPRGFREFSDSHVEFLALATADPILGKRLAKVERAADAFRAEWDRQTR